MRILVVDDYEPLRYLKARLLSRAGAEVLEASAGAEACRLLESERIDLVLMDINLPDMQGPEVVRAMRASPATSAVMVIYTSASELDRKMEQGEIFLQEPFDRQTLVEAIQKLTGRGAGGAASASPGSG